MSSSDGRSNAATVVGTANWLPPSTGVVVDRESGVVEVVDVEVEVVVELVVVDGGGTVSVVVVIASARAAVTSAIRAPSTYVIRLSPGQEVLLIDL